MFRNLLFFVVQLAIWPVLSQINGFQYDTLKYSHSTLGSLDTFDLSSRPLSSSFIFPNQNQNIYFLQPRNLFSPGKSIFTNSLIQKEKMTFTALPHIGFGYSFGAQATQNLTFDYEQAFKHGFLINCSVNNLKTEGFFRNTNVANSNYQIALGRNGKIHSFELKGDYSKSERNWNGGITDDSLSNFFAPALIPVLKENAQSINKTINLDLQNKFTIVNDSSQLIGIAIKQNYQRNKRLYSEIDSISSIYSSIYLDSSETNDSLLQQNFKNNVGLFYFRKNLLLEAGVNSNYWNNQAFSFKNDTLEFGLYSEVELAIKKFNLHQKGNYNLIGAANGFSNEAAVSTAIAETKIQLSHRFSNQLPSVFQRFFYSNNVVYKTENLEREWFQNFNAEIGRDFYKQQIKLGYEFGQFDRIYQFDQLQNRWRNDLTTSKGTYQQIALKTNLNWRWLNCNLNYQFTIMDQQKQFVPSHTFNSRIFVKGGIFKAKKLKALLGIDFIATSSYKRLNFIPQMTIFDLEQSMNNQNTTGFMNLAAFTSFEVETFRLFIRMDNIAYFWQDRSIEFVNGYTFPSTQIKVGITWDFWN
jgi:hypothetical protein